MDPGSGDSHLYSNEIASSSISDIELPNINQAGADELLSFLSIDVEKESKLHSSETAVEEGEVASGLRLCGVVEGEVGNQRDVGNWDTLVRGGGLSVGAQVGGLGGGSDDLRCGTTESMVIASDRATEPIAVERSNKEVEPSKPVRVERDGSPQGADGALEFAAVNRPVRALSKGSSLGDNGNEVGPDYLGSEGTEVGVIGDLGSEARKKDRENREALVVALIVKELLASIIHYFQEPVGFLIFEVTSLVERCLGGGAASIAEFGFGTESRYQNTSEFIGEVVGMIALVKLGGRDAGVKLRRDSKTALKWGREEKVSGEDALNAAFVMSTLCIQFHLEINDSEFLKGVDNWTTDDLSRSIEKEREVAEIMVSIGEHRW